MISQDRPATNFSPQEQPTSLGWRILSISSLILALTAIGTSAFLIAQIIPLHRKVAEFTPIIQNQSSESATEIVVINQKIAELGKTMQSQSAKLSKNDAAIVNLNQEFSQIKTTQTELKNDLSQITSSDQERGLLYVDTDEPQDIGHGFLVTNLNTYLTHNGVSLTGTIINTAYIQHRNASFRITIAGQSKPLVISQILPGESQRFEVTFPDIPISKANRCRILYENSQVVTGDSSQGGFYP